MTARFASTRLPLFGVGVVNQLTEQPFQAIPYDKLLCNGQYLCFDPRRPGYVVGMWTDRWIQLNHEMVFDVKVQRAARDCLVPLSTTPEQRTRMIQIDKEITVETKHHAEIDRHKLIAILRQAGHSVPNDAVIFMRVPGCDSNCTLDIDDAPIQTPKGCSSRQHTSNRSVPWPSKHRWPARPRSRRTSVRSPRLWSTASPATVATRSTTSSGRPETWIAQPLFFTFGVAACGPGFIWGGQFDHWWFTWATAAVVFALGLTYLDVWSLPNFGFRDAQSDFGKGVLTTILSSACSGPFLGAVFAASISEPWWKIITLFMLIGAGLVAPYLLFPRKWIPKPGAWMVWGKKLAGLSMVATAGWRRLPYSARLAFPADGAWR